VSPIAFGNVSILAEEHSLRELFRVLDENVTIGPRSEEVKSVLVEYRIFRFLSTIYKLFVDFPANRTHITILT